MLRKSLVMIFLVQLSCGKPHSGKSETQPEEPKFTYLKIDRDDIVNSEKKLRSIVDRAEQDNINIGKDFANFYLIVSILKNGGIDVRENLEYHCKRIDHYKISLENKGITCNENKLNVEVCQRKYFDPI